MPDLMEAFLLRSGTTQRDHSGRALYDHLRGTERLLRRWGCAEETCLAGLFHSIYGTNSFRYSSLAIEQRAELIELVGAKAEALVYLIHVCNRPYGLIDALQAGGVVSRLDGQFLNLEDAEIARLIEVECANLLEQASGAKFFAGLSGALEANPLALSAKAMAAVKRGTVGAAGKSRVKRNSGPLWLPP
jgi:hypothetical protein